MNFSYCIALDRALLSIIRIEAKNMDGNRIIIDFNKYFIDQYCNNASKTNANLLLYDFIIKKY